MIFGLDFACVPVFSLTRYCLSLAPPFWSVLLRRLGLDLDHHHTTFH
ncbi:hypothetical protein BC938DRAFT_474987 [Jimgerdemannia flammicorona]|uniref:Uncharacterized protein n=1 Tax=Jimgerdemannia flammicorona TaxID=994334 RepID=A0A433Q192_9FUNG|nr:hypothetical protein BC938DRAFT_474987 [Jimgerdemannia flammicorona]